MKQFSYPLFKLGIVGGGQLGKMMTQKAKKMGFHVTILDPTPESPAGQVADRQIIGNFHDENKLEELAQNCDVVTYDLENVNTKVLKRLFDKGYKIFPSPYTLEIIQDKYIQKKTLSKNGIPVPEYKEVISCDDLKAFGFPVVQKTRKGGYDGRGVFVLKSEKDIENRLGGETFIEKMVDIEKEISVLVARNIKGEIKTYPVVEMVFDERANICDTVVAPARIEEKFLKAAREIAIETVRVLDGIGVFAMEMFLTKEGKILVNEVAPRPHNSGHHTIETCLTCQFEQHIRAITDLPLGSTKQIVPAVMINLLGEAGYKGKPVIEGLEEILSIPGISFHFYCKKETKPFRKMGHVTVVDKNIEKAIEKADIVKRTVKIKGEEKI
ncbi:5-(carboxyamino)imidazole ribonucleotide synthase [Desulfurobacterium atlanticum]|uniref:N5-carboxyaminoimidazole ribonucleotide synthase n=1 Tax=Desulfurobacterium atlanticum TaxID=240169 RepID=A0A238Z4C5_9BACT|nr:5-(carboxyamino)imidazole ribonucleotide synthase [Desulfurobacterium atlanticum]SNR78160.1 5-(carboxyamino)imidazole ribonucleotide synthase [Desulfurobacterium atlanticum]